jgi:hypothetical protein
MANACDCRPHRTAGVERSHGHSVSAMIEGLLEVICRFEDEEGQKGPDSGQVQLSYGIYKPHKLEPNGCGISVSAAIEI